MPNDSQPTQINLDNKNSNLVWIDCEMTGLDTHNDTIIEIACVITTGNLDFVASDSYIINKSKQVMDNMNEWCMKHHGESGLTQRVLDSTISLCEAQVLLLKFIQLHVPFPKTAPLAGNSVYMDKIFMMREMPNVVEYLHYRIVDVSTLKELCSRWQPLVFERAPAKIYGHRALDDILESIEELKYYKLNFFK